MGEPVDPITKEHEEHAERILADLRSVGESLAVLADEMATLYAHRIGLWQEGRGMDPPVRQASLGEAAGVTEVAVINALKKWRQKTETSL